MPELPEVELTTRALKPLVVGKRLADFWGDWPRGLKSSIPFGKIRKEIEGLKVKKLERRGKVLFISLNSPAELFFALHLGMSGALLFGKPEILSGCAQKKRVHFIWRFVQGQELWFRDPRKFGKVWYGTRKELSRDRYIGSLGPDALSISLPEFRNGLKPHRGQLKPLLLRQNVVAGLGNITIDEALWEAKINPRRVASDSSDKEVLSLYRAIQKVLKCVIKNKGNTIRDWIMPDGRKGRAAVRWRAYGREDKPCNRCGSKIKRIAVGGRSTYFCSTCQQ